MNEGSPLYSICLGVQRPRPLCGRYVMDPYVSTFLRSIALMSVMYLFGFTIFAAYSAAVAHDAVSLYVIFQDNPRLQLWR